MSKKYEISREAQVLLKLLRIALSTEPTAEDGKRSELFPENIDWREVIRLSYEQKVSSLAADGLKASGYDPREGKSGRQLEEFNAILAPWLEDVKNSEESYAYYLTVLSTLCQIFSANGLKPVILKGYGLSRDYPIPSHRGAGDIDFYLLDENDRPAGKRGDELLQGQYAALFHKMEHQNSYHTQYSFKGIILENHYSIIGEFHDKGKEQLLEKHLEALIAEGYTPAPDVEGAYLPSAEFTALHLMRHSFAHCYFGTLNLRQLVDYYTFMRKVGSREILDKDILHKTGLTTFADCIEDIIQMLLVDENWNVKDEYATDLLVRDIFVHHPEIRGIRNFFHWYHERERIKYLTGESWVLLTLRSVWQHMLGRVV